MVSPSSTKRANDQFLLSSDTLVLPGSSFNTFFVPLIGLGFGPEVINNIYF